MKIIFCCLIFGLTLLNSTLGFCDANESSLKLVISEVPDNNKSTIIEVKIINTSKEYVAFYNKIFFTDLSKNLVLPLSELRFYVDKGKGFERLQFNAQVSYPYFQIVDPKLFLYLGPQYLLGLEVDLNSQFKFDFPKGNYIIKAVFENRSRSWMTNFFSKEEILKMHIYEPEIFDGVIESNPLTIEIGK
jgi:hypothetical protein